MNCFQFRCLSLMVLFVFGWDNGFGEIKSTFEQAIYHTNNDSLVRDTVKNAQISLIQSGKVLRKSQRLDLGQISESVPSISLQQMLKGNMAGLYVQEPSGEPGTEQSMLIRGIPAPLFNKRDSYLNRPVVYLNGIPLLRENPYAYDIQEYSFNRIGPATNLLSIIDQNNVKSIRLITDPMELAKLGPMAANGALWITTENAKEGIRKININSYFGMVQANSVNPVNAAYENNLRKPFYQKYAPAEAYLNYPSYLSDSTSVTYYGKPDWADSYYSNTPVYSVDMSLTGGSEKANFRFFGANTRSSGNADGTSLDRYVASFFINMQPMEWLTVSSMLNGTHLSRDRNKYIRDRLAETRYVPDLSNPVSPNRSGYLPFVNQYDDAIDNNINNSLQGYFKLDADFNKLRNVFNIAFDYNQGIRDVFWPSELMDGNNFMSGYFGYNQRLKISNVISYDWDLTEDHRLQFESGQSVMSDVYKYNYNYAYRTPNDFIKIRSIDARFDSVALDGLAYRFTSGQTPKMASIYGKISYKYKDILGFSALLRNDGSSNAQEASRWFMSPAFKLDWNIKNHLLADNSWIDYLSMDISWARIGKLLIDDRFAVGPQYRVDMGWAGNPIQWSYQGVGGLSRPFSDGWIGYGLEWPYADKLDLGIKAGLLNNRVNIAINVYNKDDKNQLFYIPVATQTGFTGAAFNGMWVNNRGVDGMVRAKVLQNNSGLNWSAGLNFNYNRNILKALPQGYTELQLGERKLQVGEAVDRFWVLENNGVYQNDVDVPVNPENFQLMNYNGVPMHAGDPIWTDKNNDYVINDEDRVLAGNSVPKFTGGFNSQFAYKNWSLGFQMYFAAGHHLLNQSVASKFDFINRDGASTNISSAREITYWQDDFDLGKYPLYNPWSNVTPYRVEQDIFLQNASYLKMRSATLGYELSNTKLFGDKSTFRKFYVYLTGSNLFTVTSFEGGDPELVGLNGYYSGYGLPIPKTFTFGVNIEL